MHHQPVPRLLMATFTLVVAVACAPAAPPTATGGAANQAAQPAAQSGAQPAAQAIVLKGITAWVRDFPYNAGFWEFKRRLELNSNGSITIDWKGGPEAAPPFEQVGMVKAGVFDIVNTNGSYYTQLMPEAAILDAIDGRTQQLRAAGVIDLFDQINQQKAGVKLLGPSTGSSAFTLYLKRPVRTLEDFRGLKIRSIPVYSPLIESLGASPVTMAPAEMYSALERGVVDGYGWPRGQVEDQKLYEVSCCIVDPGWFTVREVHLVSLQTWQRLTPEQQKVLMDTQLEVETWMEEHYARESAQEMDRLVKQHGMQVSRLPEEQARRYRQLAYEGVWEKFLPTMPEHGVRLQQLAAPFSKAWPPDDYQLFQPY
jgi:TRAP-type C4-dicarboxylate transport system substrate-binding protein